MKRIKINKKLQQYAELKLLKKIYRAYEREDYPKVLELCNTVIFSDEEEINRGNREFWYYKAAAMDCMGQQIDALYLFRRLIHQYPNNPTYLNSFRIICDRIGNKAYSVFRKNPDDPLLLKYYSIFKGCWHIPYFLHVAKARDLIRSGHKQKAKEIMLSFLKLSPTDEDYLYYNLDLASEAEDGEWFDFVQHRLQRTINKFPARFELYPLLATE